VLTFPFRTSSQTCTMSHTGLRKPVSRCVQPPKRCCTTLRFRKKGRKAKYCRRSSRTAGHSTKRHTCTTVFRKGYFSITECCFLLSVSRNPKRKVSTTSLCYVEMGGLSIISKGKTYGVLLSVLSSDYEGVQESTRPWSFEVSVLTMARGIHTKYWPLGQNRSSYMTAHPQQPRFINNSRAATCAWRRFARSARPLRKSASRSYASYDLHWSVPSKRLHMKVTKRRSQKNLESHLSKSPGMFP
jgi:hypothetical protein